MDLCLTVCRRGNLFTQLREVRLQLGMLAWHSGAGAVPLGLRLALVGFRLLTVEDSLRGQCVCAQRNATHY
jgi:hypothetical protein